VRNFILASLAQVTRWLRPAYDALQVPVAYRGIPIVTRANLAAAHRLGLAVHVWTIDEQAEMERLLAFGVDGLMTDRPDVLAQVLKRGAH
jgi:glycerophosphoryl diester phosphodiesterase